MRQRVVHDEHHLAASVRAWPDASTLRRTHGARAHRRRSRTRAAGRAASALAVFLTRDEDNIQVDNLLSEKLHARGRDGEGNGRDVDLRAARAVRLGPRADRRARDAATSEISQAARLRVDRHARLRDRGEADPARRRGKVERFFDYRGEGRFAGIDTPFAELPRSEAVFRVRDLRDHPQERPWASLDALDLSLGPPQEGGREAPQGRAGADAGAAARAGRPRRRPDLGPPLCVVLEGWDASGKGGAIKRLVAKLDPRHVRVKQYAAPTRDELRHHWLWRFWPALPGWGGMAILDRSWYGRVLVERVEGYATAGEWTARLRRDQRVRADARRRRHRAREAVAAHLRRGAAASASRRARRSAEGVQAHRRGLAQPRQARAPTPRRSRRCSSARHRAGRPGTLVEGDSQALRPREGARDRDRGRRGRPARGTAAAPRRPRKGPDPEPDALCLRCGLAGLLLRAGLRARLRLRLALVLVRARPAFAPGASSRSSAGRAARASREIQTPIPTKSDHQRRRRSCTASVGRSARRWSRRPASAWRRRAAGVLLAVERVLPPGRAPASGRQQERGRRWRGRCACA